MRPSYRPAKLPGLVDRIYCAAEDQRHWPRFLDQFADAIGGRHTILLFVDRSRAESTILSHVRTDPETVRDFHENWGGKRNPYLTSGHPLMNIEGSVVVGHRIVPNDTMRRSAFHNRFAAPAGIGDLIGMNIVIRPPVMASITTHFGPRDGEREPLQEHLCRTLMPHLQRAVRLSLKLRKVTAERRSLGEALDRTSDGIVLVDEHGRIVHANREGERILQQQDGISVRFGALHAGDPATADRLRALIGTGGSAAIPRPSLKPPYTAHVWPLSTAGQTRQQHSAAAVVVLKDPSVPPNPDATLIQHLFGLTPAETRVAQALIKDKTREEIAGEFGVSENTIRTQVRAVYEKAGVSNRAALARILSRVSA